MGNDNTGERPYDSLGIYSTAGKKAFFGIPFLVLKALGIPILLNAFFMDAYLFKGLFFIWSLQQATSEYEDISIQRCS